MKNEKKQVNAWLDGTEVDLAAFARYSLKRHTKNMRLIDMADALRRCTLDMETRRKYFYTLLADGYFDDMAIPPNSTMEDEIKKYKVGIIW